MLLLGVILVAAIGSLFGLGGKDTLVDPEMTYAEFQSAAVAGLDVVHDDLIVFDVPNAALFQAMRANPTGYLPLM